MSKYNKEAGYDVGVQFPTTRPGLNPNQVGQVSGALTDAPTREVPYPALTVSQNNFALGPGDFHEFPSHSGISITGFGGQRAGLQTIVNADASNNLTLENDDAGSDPGNRILCHTGADIVLGPGESVLIRYVYRISRWRTIGF